MTATETEGEPIVSDYLTTEQACEYLNVSKPTLYAWGRAVRPAAKRVKYGRLVRWPRRELDRMAQSALKTLR